MKQEKKLLSFHNDPAIKEKYIARIEEHRRLEHLVQGTGWNLNGEVKGCAIGCTLESYDHSRYPIELGLPEWLARLEDFLFEKLSKEKAENFAVNLLKVIPVGINVNPVKHQLAILRIDKSLKMLKNNKENYATECQNAINLVKAWHFSQISSNNELDQNTDTWSAAESAARSAESAAAWSEHIEWEAETLLSLLSKCK